MSVTPAFTAARKDNRAALVGYLPAGFPTVEKSRDALRTLVDSGVDVIEVGLPYSDPVMDGPAIQQAANLALHEGFRVNDVFDLVSSVSNQVPVMVMTYWNLVEHYGVEAFGTRLAQAGGSGLITPDLIPDEAEEWMTVSDAANLDRTFLVAPSSTDDRIKSTVDACRGFVYAQSVMGVTGARDAVSQVAPELVERTRRFSDLPIGVGLGVRTGEQAAAIARYADAVIVGSAMVNSLLEAPTHADGLRTLGKLTEELAAGVRGRG
ncbi:tryptophan synthase subunit alpha [Haloglycomyces albus]|uniref:tryptophan synthase subunit alpha n=1 Tax=Haloglycomyces albus TaxID=526067 RepID=UPI00046C98B4|nr:tryptophan synthase subunit alpha [Haloglycomyces albus]